MKNRKCKILSLLALIITVSLISCLCEVKADANVMDNGSVQYAVVKDEDGLRQYIDNDGAYSSRDEVKFEEYTNLYKIIIDEPGNLLICPLADYVKWSVTKPEIYVYSDFKMSSTLISDKYTVSDRNPITFLHVDPGTYYYRSIGGGADDRRSDRKNTLTVYVGFIPDDPSSAETTKLSQSDTQQTEDTYINYILINDTEELADYIDLNGTWSVQEKLSIHELGQPYAVQIIEPGELVICPLVTQAPHMGIYSTDISVFTNKDLSSKILDSAKAQGSNRFDYYHVTVDPGTYYIQAVGGAAPSWGDNYMTLYVGFIPSSGQLIEKYEPSNDESHASPIQYAIIQDENSIVSTLFNQETPASHHELDMHEVSELYSFTVDEPGKIVVAAITDGYASNGFYFTELSLFSNSDATSAILRHNACNDTNTTYSWILVDKGTYYYSIRGGATSTYEKKAKTDAYIGFIPTSNVFSIDHTEALNTEAKVYFSTSANYDPDKYRALIRVVPGRVFPHNVDNNEIWQEQTMDNAIESHEFIATENGVYTAKISGNSLSPYLLTFEVTDIGSNEETPPTDEQPVTDNAQPETESASDSEERSNLAEQPVEEKETANEATVMTASEMRKYIRMLEDQIEDLGLEIPEFSEDIALNEYMTSLEQVLRDNGYDF